MPYGQSPWEDASDSVGNVGASLSRVAYARAIGQARANQFAQQMAIRQAQLQIQRERLQQQGALDTAREGQADSAAGVNYQKMDRQDQMDVLARAIGQNVFQKQMPGGVRAAMGPMQGQGANTPIDISAEMMHPSINPQPDNAAIQGGPTTQGAGQLNQADLVRNVMQLIAMHNPNELGTMMLGKDISRGGVNYNPVTGEMIMGQPPAPGRTSYVDPDTGMTPYQMQQLIIERARLKDEEDSRKIANTLKKNSPDYKMAIADGSESDDEGAADSQSGSKQLDAATAKDFLQKAGGNKDKARQMAKDAGYTF